MLRRCRTRTSNSSSSRRASQCAPGTRPRTRTCWCAAGCRSDTPGTCRAPGFWSLLGETCSAVPGSGRHRPGTQPLPLLGEHLLPDRDLVRLHRVDVEVLGGGFAGVVVEDLALLGQELDDPRVGTLVGEEPE